MKKIMMAVLAGAMAVSLIACGTNSNEEPIGGDPATWGPAEDGDTMIGGDSSTWGPAEGDDSVQIPAPFKEYGTMDEAQKAAGFDVKVPASVDGINQSTILVYELDSNMIEVQYDNGTTKAEIRKAAFDADGAENISGVFTTFAQSTTVEQDGVTVTMEGANNLVNVATWTIDNYNYSIYSEAGMAQADVLKLIAEIL